MPQLDPDVFLPQLVWLTITFVVLYVLMVRTALPRIAEVLEARREHITHDLDAAAALKAEADRALAEYEASIAAARHRGDERGEDVADADADPPEADDGKPGAYQLRSFNIHESDSLIVRENRRVKPPPPQCRCRASLR